MSEFQIILVTLRKAQSFSIKHYYASW